MGLGPAVTGAPAPVCWHCSGHLPHHTLEPELSFPNPAGGWAQTIRRRAWGGASPVGRTDPLPVALPQSPRPASYTESPQDCGRRPWDAARGRWEEPARRPGSAAWRGASLRRARGGPGWGPGRGPGREFWVWVQGGGPGQVEGRNTGSVEPGRAAQDESSILRSLSTSIASAGSRASERERVGLPGLRLTGRSGWRKVCRWRGLTCCLRRQAAAGAENRCPAGPAPNE